MTDTLSMRPTRGLRGGAMTADEMGDVLASIRRLIAQDDGAHGAAQPEPAAPALHAVPDPVPEDAPPLRLRREALIPPTELPRHVQDGRLRLTAASAVVDRPAGGESARMAAIIRAATAARDRPDAPLADEMAAEAAAPATAPEARPAPPERLGLDPALDATGAWLHELRAEAGPEPAAAPAQAAPNTARKASPDHAQEAARNDALDDTLDDAPPHIAAWPDPLAREPDAGIAPTATLPPSGAIMAHPAAPVPAPAPPAHTPPVPAPDAAAAPITAARALAGIEAAQDRPLDDPDSTALHLFAHADEDVQNGALLRSLLREAIRQELQGEMGARFSRNLRQLIRQESAAAMTETRSA